MDFIGPMDHWEPRVSDRRAADPLPGCWLRRAQLPYLERFVRHVSMLLAG
jgi:hypothetical protein